MGERLSTHVRPKSKQRPPDLVSFLATTMAASDRDVAIRVPQQTWDRRLIGRESKELKVRVSAVSNPQQIF